MAIPLWEARPVPANPVDPTNRSKSVACDGAYGFSKPKYDKKTYVMLLVESWIAVSPAFDRRVGSHTGLVSGHLYIWPGNGLEQGG